MPKIVFTGGTYSGKSTLLEHFKKEGFNTVPESGMKTISEVSQKLGVEEQKKWRKEQPIEFFRLIFERQEEAESKIKANEDEYIFHDRGFHDYLAFIDLVDGVKPPPEFVEVAKNNPYDIAFVFEIIPKFENREETGRVVSEEESIKLREHLIETYKKFGVKVILVKGTVFEERVKFVKEKLEI